MWYDFTSVYIHTHYAHTYNTYTYTHVHVHIHTHTHTHTHTVGCPDCTRKCNIDLHDKLKILFPNMANKRIIAVIPTENGKNDAI